MISELTITKPDDWHLHLRDGDMLKETVPASARCFKRAIIMPNLVPPVVRTDQAMNYMERILSQVPEGGSFEPLMTLYLTDNTTIDEIRRAKAEGVVAAKMYPAGATTNSDRAVTNINLLNDVFSTMAEVGMLLLIHGEVTDPEIDIFDREKIFIERYLSTIVKEHPNLKIVMEHITTKDAVEFIMSTSDKISATVTPQHLLLNRNDMLVGGIHPHNYCLPVLKRNIHQMALREAISSGTHKIFLGTDSAPHTRDRKESSCGCAGCYTAVSALELYAQIFEELGILEKLEAFASFNGPDFYGLARNKEKITLRREQWIIPEEIKLPNGEIIVPFFAGKTLNWKVI
jgi:dihydroorotase